MLGVRRDEDDVARADLGDAMGAVELELALEDDDRLRLAVVDVRPDVLIRLRDDFAEPPPLVGVGSRDDLAQGRASSGLLVAVGGPEDSNAVQLAHGQMLVSPQASCRRETLTPSRNLRQLLRGEAG